MSLPFTPPGSAANTVIDAAYCRGALHELIELGMALARRIAAAPENRAAGEPEGEAKGEAEGEAGAETAVAFERVSRTVRQTVRLAQFVAQPAKARRELGREQNRTAARERVYRERRSELARREERDAERQDDTLERLDGLDGLDGLDRLENLDRGRPVDEVIEEIRADLTVIGAAFFPRRRTARMAARGNSAASPALAGGGASLFSRPGGAARGMRRVGAGRRVAGDTS